MTRLLLFLCLLTSYEVAGQYLVTGVVRDRKKNALPGVNIKTHYNDKIVDAPTDGEGKFTLNSPTPNPTLSFSFPGYETKTVVVDDTGYVKITLHEDSREDLGNMVYEGYTRVGLSSGIRYTPVGIRIASYTPQIFNLSPHLYTALEYRTNTNKNDYFDVYLQRYLVRNNMGDVLQVAGQFRQLETPSINIREFNGMLNLRLGRFTIHGGYVYQQSSGEMSRSGSGALAGVDVWIPNTQFYIDAKTKYVLHNFQHDMKVTWRNNDLPFSFGLGYQRFAHLDEIIASILYKINY